MRKSLLLLLGLFCLFFFHYNILLSQDTFSIVAVDPVTGEVGSAGASCIAGSIIISDVHTGVGVIHTQSYWNAANQNYARTLMNLGLSPQQIIDSLIMHDAQGNPSIQQYGIVDLIDSGRSAAFTGSNCYNYKNHITGPTYAIQGNILLGQQILDSMEARFLNTPGTLADKLMAALQGAKVPGADTRCLGYGTSSLSAFIRVARLQDTTATLYLDLNVNSAPIGVEPIDSLQVLYNMWVTNVSNYTNEVPDRFILYQNYPNPFNPKTKISYGLKEAGNVKIIVYDALGKEVSTLIEQKQTAGTYSIEFNASNQSSGVYIYSMIVNGIIVETRRMVLTK
ncbi:MAG: DUF1028 domain-containing protein [Ignavibacteria bacterium]|nr:DUF1028 domain-containing protein [Ignavibacteria bacterium]